MLIYSISAKLVRLPPFFDKQLKIEVIAREPGMSVAGFHHQFKSVTSMIPLQFQEPSLAGSAEEMDAASAGFRLGIERKIRVAP